MIYVGVDPGANGGIGVIDTHEDSAEAFLYSEDKLMEVIHLPGRMRVLVEEVHSMPKQGVASTFSFGMNYGIILGILKALHQQYDLVTPRKWKKEFSLNGDKKKSIECCKRLFPKVELRKSEKSRTEHDGMAEALLIAEYARRHMR